MKLITIILTITIVSAITQATEYAGAYQELGAGAKATGTGLAQVANANDAYATYWNPAGLTNISKMDLNASFTSYYGIVNHKVFNYAHVYEKGVLAFGYLSTWVDGILSTEYTNGRQVDLESNYSYSAATIYLSKADDLSTILAIPQDKAAYGLSIKFMGEGFSERPGASAIGLDFGLQYKESDELTVGLNLQNIVKTPLEWDSPSKSVELIPTIIKIGAAYQFTPKLSGLLDFDLKDSRAYTYHAGLEYNVNDSYTLRAGLNNGQATLGLGLYYNQYKLDYAYQASPYNYIDSTHLISIGFWE